MAKLKKLSPLKIKKISGGKDPTRLVEEFISRRGFNASECLRQRTGDDSTWCVPLSEEEELEITLEGINRPMETTIYMGLNVMAVPVKNSSYYLAAALLVADRLIGGKLSLVNYDLVLSVTNYLSDMGIEEIDYIYELINRQKSWLRDEIVQEASRDEFDAD
jgi:hypothetical protein